MPDHTRVTIPGPRPMCDLCKAFKQKDDVPAFYDGATIQGPWAYMCLPHFHEWGVGLGLGRGQWLIIEEESWTK